jgi:hypothetical protein
VPFCLGEGADGADAPVRPHQGTNGVVKGLLDDINPQSTDGSRAWGSNAWARSKGVTMPTTEPDRARRRAEALFKQEERLRNGQKAMAEYEANRIAVWEKTARLRALRLARDAAIKQAGAAGTKRRSG